MLDELLLRPWLNSKFGQMNERFENMLRSTSDSWFCFDDVRGCVTTFASPLVVVVVVK